MSGYSFRQLVRSYPVYFLACNVHTRLSILATPNRCTCQQVSRSKSSSSLLVSKSSRSQLNSTSNCSTRLFHTKRIRWLGNVDQLKA
jgi:hypothetical protein